MKQCSTYKCHGWIKIKQHFSKLKLKSMYSHNTARQINCCFIQFQWCLLGKQYNSCSLLIGIHLKGFSVNWHVELGSHSYSATVLGSNTLLGMCRSHADVSSHGNTCCTHKHAYLHSLWMTWISKHLISVVHVPKLLQWHHMKYLLRTSFCLVHVMLNCTGMNPQA